MGTAAGLALGLAPVSAMPSLLWRGVDQVHLHCTITNSGDGAAARLCEAVREAAATALKRPVSRDPAPPGALVIHLRGAQTPAGTIAATLWAERAALRGETVETTRRVGLMARSNGHAASDAAALMTDARRAVAAILPQTVSARPVLRRADAGQTPPRANRSANTNTNERD